MTEATNSVLEVLKALDLSTLPAEKLVPLIKSIQAIGAFAAVVDAEIQRRAVTEGELIPGAMVKDAVKHRQWSDKTAAEQLAREEFGDEAFETKLKSPAGIEKLGPKGKQFVSVASFKPDGGKVAVY